MKSHNKIRLFLKNRSILIILSLISILQLPNLLLIFIGIDSYTNTILKSIVFLAVSFSYILLGIILVRPKIFFILMLPFVVLEFGEILNILIFKLPTSIDIIITALGTNSGESTELLSNYWILLIIALITCVIYIVFIIKLPVKFKISLQSKYILLTIILFINVSVIVRNFIKAEINTPQQGYKSNFYKAYGDYKSRLINNSYPLNTFSRITAYLDHLRFKKEYLVQSSGFSFHSKDSDSLQTAKCIVLVLGEAARAGNFSLNEYYLNTNPLLSSISNNIYNFFNVFSGANLTQPSLIYLLSEATPINRKIAFHEKSFLTAFKEQGYFIYWISNQQYDPDNLSYYYSKEADSLIINNISETQNATDANLLPQFSEILKSSSNKIKRLFVIHTLGSHNKYNYRFPKSFEHFVPSINDNFDLTLSQKDSIFKLKLVNAYNNSILYTDYILYHLINTLDKQDEISSLIYISDHGENLMDDSASLMLHGGSNPTFFEVHVPMIVWASQKFIKQYPLKIRNLQNHCQKFYSSSNLPYLMWGIANIDVDRGEIYDITSSKYQEPDSIFVFTSNLWGLSTKELATKSQKFKLIRSYN